MQDQTPKQQAVELINTAKDVLVVSHQNPDGDALGSTIALKLVLEKLGKKATIAIPDKPSGLFAFMPRIGDIETFVDTSKNLIINLKLTHASFDKIGYKRNQKDESIDVVITPKEGKFEAGDVTINASSQNFDLIIVVDTPNIERLGSLAEPADIFYEVPTINIDHHPANEKFGKVNWIELVATSTAEMLVSLIEALGKDKNLLDEDIATALLTGLIYDTSSFQNVNTTPKSLTIAAQLVAAGAHQQEIVRNLYKTKSLETLKLWGNVLTKIKEDKIHSFLWSSVTKDEIEKSGADESALSQVVDELLKSASDVDFALLLSERNAQVHGSLRSIAKGVNVSRIAELFGGGGHEVAAAFRVDGTLEQKEDEILQKIRELQAGHTVERKRDIKKEGVIEEEKGGNGSEGEGLLDVKDNPESTQKQVSNADLSLGSEGGTTNTPIVQKSELESDSSGPVDLKEEFKEDIETKW